jgi:osmotically-inducible protein OsmY
MNGFGSSTGGSSMYGGRSYGAVTQAGGGGGTSMTGGGGGRTTSGSTSSGGGGGTAASTNRRRGTANASTASKEQQAWFEPRIEIGFETSPRQVSAVASTVATSLGANKPNSRFGSVQVAFEGGTAILRGVVATPNDRILAEQIALLEPSVSAVRNDLTVAPRANPATGK